MAERRMFAKNVIDSDMFLSMPLSTQALYFHLSMRADDDGFINNPRSIQRICGASDDDFKVLLAKQFLISFATGVVVIRHWKIHNYIQKDRYHPTDCITEKSNVVEENGIYSLMDTVSPVIEAPEMHLSEPCIQNVSNMDTECIQPVSKMDTQVRLGKDRLCKDSVDNTPKPPKGASAEVVKEIVDYLNQRIGTKYRNVRKTGELISARINEGFTVEDFKLVIEKKANEWIGTDMEKYLRPETLFGTKFEGYLNAPEKPHTPAAGKKSDGWDSLYAMMEGAVNDT